MNITEDLIPCESCLELIPVSVMKNHQCNGITDDVEVHNHFFGNIDVNQESVRRFIEQNNIQNLQDLILKSNCFVCRVYWASTLKEIIEK